jgi:pimeloyl-ACP methyl ester carboxylesterase
MLRLRSRAPGQRIDISKRRLHVRDSGRGSPVVVLEAGAGGWSSHWGEVPARLASTTRVLAYDRAGLGWSDPARGPRPASRLVDDLLALLDALAIHEPVVIAGHSFGGAVARLAAARAPGRVAGVVFVDAWHEAMAAWEQQRGVDAGAPTWLLRVHAAAAALGLWRLVAALLPSPPPPANWQISAAAWRDILDRSATAAYARTVVQEMDAASASDAETAAVTRLDLPVRVLVARETISRNDAPGGYPVDEHNRVWLETARHLAALSADARMTIIDDIDHNMPLRQPDMVADAIAKLVLELRAHALVPGVS